MFTGYGFNFHVLYFNVTKHQFIICVLYNSFSLKGLLIFCSFFCWLNYWLPRFLYKISHLLWYQLLSFVFWLGFWCICMLCVFSPLIPYLSGLPDSLYHKAGLYGLCYKSSLASWLPVLIQWKEIESRKGELMFVSEGPSVLWLGQNCHFITSPSLYPQLSHSR